MITFRHIISCIFLLALVSQLVQSAPAADDVGELLDELLNRIESLEVSDAENKAKIAQMETEFKLRHSESEREIFVLKEKIKKMESDFKNREEILLKRIYKQAKSIDEVDSGDMVESNSDDMDQIFVKDSNPQKRRSSIRKVRDVPEMEIAFYATHVVHNNHDLGANQIIPFQQTVTNLGNAYNNITSIFVAPVDGTYVFHATVMGIDVPSGHSHFKAHFDVDGTSYSIFYVSAYDQSSQMLVINLKSGQSVSVKNDYLDAGFIGKHFSSFSGFLLYQNLPTSPTIDIVGK